MIMVPTKRNQNWLPGIFNDVFGNECPERPSAAVPAVNVIDGEHNYCVEVAAPGLTKDDFRVDITPDNELVIPVGKETEQKRRIR